MSQYSKKLTSKLGRKDDTEKKRNFIAQSILDALKVDSVLDMKIDNDRKLKNDFDLRQSIERKLITIENQLSGEFQVTQNKNSGSNIIGMTSEQLLALSRSREDNLRIRKELTDTLKKIN